MGARPGTIAASVGAERSARRTASRQETRGRRPPVKRRDDSLLGPYGEPPPSPFGLPVSEFAILVGAVGVIVGLVSSAPTALVVGVVVCALGVAEFTAREHFSGYRSHATLLAAMPAVAVGVALIAVFGGSLRPAELLPVVAVVFLTVFALLRKRFRTARQARIARPPGP
jgi:hypothetical protein